MSTSWEDFTRLLEQHPSEADSIDRLRKQVFEGAGEKYNRDRLFDILAPTSEMAMIQILETLVQNGVLERFVGVRTPTGRIIPFAAMQEVPPVVEDVDGETLEVSFGDIEVFYLVPR